MTRQARILWLSRHPPLPAQLAELYRLWPRCHIHREPDTFADAAEIIRRIRKGNYDELVIVAPLSVIDQLCQHDLKPIRAEMERIERYEDPTRDVSVNGRVYRFREFRRIVRLELITELITPINKE